MFKEAITILNETKGINNLLLNDEMSVLFQNTDVEYIESNDLFFNSKTFMLSTSI